MKNHTPMLTEVEQAAQEGLRDGMRVMLERARHLAPKDDRDLVRSGGVRIDDLTGQVSFTAAHAAKQHEDLELEHATGGQAKFLETAAGEVLVEQFVAEKIAERLSG